MQFLEHKVIFILVQPNNLCYAVSMKHDVDLDKRDDVVG